MNIPSFARTGTTGLAGHHQAISDLQQSLSHALSTLRIRAAALGHGIMLGRMESVLNSLSDHELAQIGIAREDIKDRAKQLIS